MIVLKSIQLTNFLSHKNTELEFKDDSQLLIDGFSGSGKSSIIEAIIWAFYGRGRSDNRSLIRHGAKQAEVELEVGLSAPYIDRWRIVRKVNDKGKQTLEVSEQDNKGMWHLIKKIGLKDVQHWIETELLHCSYTLFTNSVVSPQENADNFVQQTAAKRKEMLLEVVNAADFDLYYNRAKEKVQLTNESLARSHGKIEVNESIIAENRMLADSLPDNLKAREEVAKDLQMLKDRLDTLYAKKEQFASKRAKAEGLDAQISTAKSGVIQFQSQIRQKETQIEELGKLTTVIDTDTILKSTKALREFKEQLVEMEAIEKYDYERQQELNKVMASRPTEIDYDTEINRLEKAKEGAMAKVDLWCPDIKRICPRLQVELNDRMKDTNGRIDELVGLKNKQGKDAESYKWQIAAIGEPQSHLTPDAFRAEIQGVRWQIERLSGLQAEADKIKMSSDLKEILLGEIQETMKLIGTQEVNITAMEKDRMALLAELTELNQLEVNILSLNNELSQADTTVQMAERAVALSEQAVKNISVLEEDIKKIKIESASQEEDVFNLNLVKEAFGTKGIKTIVVEMLVPRLEDKINEILGKISNFSVRLETQKEAAGGENTIEGFYINIINDQGQTFEFSNYSGGEKNRINYAIFEALASLQHCGFRIYDEAVSGLNDEIIDEFADTLLNLNTGKQVLCVSHLETVKDKFAEKVLVKKVNGISKIS